MTQVVSLGFSVLITVAIIRICSPKVLDFRPPDGEIVAAVIVAESAAWSVGALTSFFWQPDPAELTFVTVFPSLVLEALLCALALMWIVRDPQGNRMEIMDAALFATVLIAAHTVLLVTWSIWTGAPLRVW